MRHSRQPGRSKIELFKSRAKIARCDEQLFAEPSWLAVFLGRGSSLTATTGWPTSPL
ncbi:tryptophan 7-halogenase [Caulobacter segnis]